MFGNCQKLPLFAYPFLFLSVDKFVDEFENLPVAEQIYAIVSSKYFKYFVAVYVVSASGIYFYCKDDLSRKQQVEETLIKFEKFTEDEEKLS